MAKISEEYFLIFEGPKDQEEGTLTKIKGILVADFEFSASQVHEIISNCPSPISSATSNGDLKKEMKILDKAGGKVFILSPDGTKEYQKIPKARNLESMALEMTRQKLGLPEGKEGQKKKPPSAVIEFANESKLEFSLNEEVEVKEDVAPDSQDEPGLNLDVESKNADVGGLQFEVQSQIMPESLSESKEAPVVEEEKKEEPSSEINFAFEDSEQQPEKKVEETSDKSTEVKSEEKLFAGMQLLEDGENDNLLSTALEVNEEHKSQTDDTSEEINLSMDANVEIAEEESEAEKIDTVEIDLSTQDSATSDIEGTPVSLGLKLSQLNEKTRSGQYYIKEVGGKKEEEDPYSELKMAGVKRKKGFRKSLDKYSDILEDVIVPVVIGSLVLVGINFYVFESDIKAKRAEEEAILVGDGGVSTSDGAADGVAVELKHFSNDRGLVKYAKMHIVSDRYIDKTDLIFIGPKPKDLTPEEILTKKIRDPWLKEFVVDSLNVALFDKGILRGMGTGYGYVNYQGKDEAIYGNVNLNGTYGKDDKIVQFQVEIERGSLKREGDSNFKIEKIGRNFAFSFGTSFILDMHSNLPEIDDDGQFILDEVTRKIMKGEKVAEIDLVVGQPTEKPKEKPIEKKEKAIKKEKVEVVAVPVKSEPIEIIKHVGESVKEESQEALDKEPLSISE